MDNYYDILEVPKNASEDDIKKSYRRLSKKYHPDINNGNDEKFKQINEAYSVLSDFTKRRQYDNFGNGFSFEDMFSAAGFDFMGGNMHARARGSDIKIDLSVSVEDTFKGGEKKISYYRRSENGADELREINISIPSGVDDGSMLRVRGGGNSGERFNGDLLIYINVIPDEKYDKVGPHLHYTVELNPIDLLLGKEVMIDYFGETLKANLKGPIDVNKGFTLRGKGFNTPIGKGNMYLRFKIVTPMNLSDYEVSLLSSLKECESFKD
jgi:curved DNA-binding protein